MSPGNPYVIAQLRQLIYYHLDCNLLRNALFLAGRLQAYEPRSSEAAYLLALCHLRLGQLKAAYDCSRPSGPRVPHIGRSYVFAQACLGLERYVEGITAIDRSRSLWTVKSNWNKHSETRRQTLPDAAAFHCLQGKLWNGYRDTNKAIECFAEALKLNPFMWDAFIGLCDLGVNARIPNIFKLTSEMTNALENLLVSEKPIETADDPLNSNSIFHGQFNNSNSVQQPSGNDPFCVSKNRINGEVRPNADSLGLFKKFNISKNTTTPVGGIAAGIDFQGLDTPTGHGGGLNMEMLSEKEGIEATAAISADPTFAPVRKVRTLQGSGMDLSIEAPPKMRSNSVKAKSRSKGDSEDISIPTTGITSTLTTGMGDRKRTVSGQPPRPISTNIPAGSTANPNDPMAPQRRSVRLFNQIRPQSGKFATSAGSVGVKEGRELKKAKATGAKGRSANTFNVGRVVSGNRKHGEPVDVDGKEQKPLSNMSSGVLPTNSRPAISDNLKAYEGLQWLLDLCMKLGSGYFALRHFKCHEAIQIFNSVSPSQRDTPWVLAQIGRAYFEQGLYGEAEKYFARIKIMTPSTLEDMEVYSTTLWHLKKEVDLAFLAHEIVENSRDSPQAWCAVGNSFSLQRDHDQAVKCFKRATQLDPQFAYAFTLQGHEHIANEEYDKALSAFRSAIAAENRHYNAWYGLGKVFEKQGKFEFAEHHYRTAADINPTNAVLICCIGVVLEKMRNPKAALVQYTRSCELAPQTPLSRFRKARVLMALQEPQKALVELKVLKDMAPEEANVHFLLGRVYKTLRQKAYAIKHFTMALNLDPKASHHIKEAMEQIEDGSDDDEMDAHDG